jgi:glutamyl/glutaminyl-tRNA synthetase
MPGAGAFGQRFPAMVRTLGPESRLRYAPTPSGFLHPGNAFNFILNYLAARARPGARLLLRIDDLDGERKRPEYILDIFHTLRWLGLDWDEGPRDPEDFEANWSQRHRMARYQSALEELRATGLLFACGKSRRELATYGTSYPEWFREQNLSLDAPGLAWRIRTSPGFPLPDFIVRRRDGFPAYQLSSLVDDLHFGVTHLIRGDDLRDSTRAQQYLAESLGWTAFGRIEVLHHPLILDDQGQKLSKSAGSASLQSLYRQGEPPSRIFQELASWLGWGEKKPSSAAELLTLLQSRLPTP